MQLFREQRLVRYAGREAVLGDLSFRLVALLAEAAPEAVSYDRIAEAVWGTGVTRETLKQRVKLLREELRAIGVPENAIEAIHNSGYRLTLDAHVAARPRASVPPGVLATIAAAVLGAAVLWYALRGEAGASPQVNIAVMSEDLRGTARSVPLEAAQEGLVRNLSRLDDVVVIDASAGRDGAPDGARDDLRASLTLLSAAEGDRLAIRLTSAPHGYVLWAENYPLDPARLERILLHAANNIHAMAVTLGGALGDAGYPAQSPEVQREYLRALRRWRSGELPRLLEARAGLQSILTENGDFSLAASLLARVNADLVIAHGYPPASVSRDEARLERLLERHPGFADFHYSMARVQLALGRKASALDYLRRAEPGMPFVSRDVQALERQIAASRD